MTDSGSGATPQWVPVLRELSRTTGHELRNALNALVVNLEVVRSRSHDMDAAVQPFVSQAVEQSEESVRLAEGTIALLNLVVNAVGPDGGLRICDDDPQAVRIESTESDAARALHAFQPIAARSSFAAESRGTAVILSMRDKSHETTQSND